jgi:hypothetical protein
MAWAAVRRVIGAQLGQARQADHRVVGLPIGLVIGARPRARQQTVRDVLPWQ